jgi:hypothetical protein
MESLKYSVFVIWLGSAAAMVAGGPDAAGVGRMVFVGTLLAHLAEFVWKRSLFERAGGPVSHHFVQTMIYGLFYWKPIEDGLKRR